MLVWRGYGILALVIGAAGAIGAGLVAQALPKAGDAQDNLLLAAGFLLAAVVNWFVGVRLNRAPGRLLVDPATGERVVLRARHSLFFLEMQWWSLVMLGLAALLLATAVFGLPAAPPSQN